MSYRRRRRPAGGLIPRLLRPAAVGAALLAGCGPVLASCSSGPDPTPVASSFLASWAKGDYGGGGGYTDAKEKAAAFLKATHDDLLVSHASLHLDGTDTRGSTATARFTAKLALRGIGTWSYQGRLSLIERKGRWLVRWSPADVYPQLPPTGTLARFRSLPPRAEILAADGSVLVGPQPVVVVGLVPSLVKDLPSTLATLARTTGIDPNRVAGIVAHSPPQSFVPVITLRQAAYEAVKPVIYPLPGVQFHQQTADLAPSPTFGLAVLGRVGPATAEALAKVGAPYEATDDIGLAGLELAFQRRLAGTPTGGVELQGGSGGPVLRRIVLTSGTPGAPVHTTIDPAVQRAAEAALVGVAKPAALVAVQASTGAVLADAEAPADSTYDRGMVGSYPPGSSFKIVTAAALLGTGVTPATTAPCPPRAVIDGKPFTNFEGEAPGAVPFSVDFARSCNTAFVTLASRLPAPALLTSAADFGFGSTWRLPVGAYSGQVPQPKDGAELVSDAIGQGRVLASPLTMALVAAAADAGTWRPPVLVTDPAQATGASAPATVPPAIDSQLHDLMRLVVTSGTGTAANLPGPPVYGKTGTAEFGPGNPPATHAWFVGFRGDLAFAVLVEGGGVGGQVAAP
ncbi:MAG TPA: penicillin-binding transpeptidase domain-containing protein, partial [Acidimicrobiales bacterium]|nr:penicillin-binding transpeptidase domain-containing protein [Acidimicrobiales bacterium]